MKFVDNIRTDLEHQFATVMADGVRQGVETIDRRVQEMSREGVNLNLAEPLTVTARMVPDTINLGVLGRLPGARLARRSLETFLGLVPRVEFTVHPTSVNASARGADRLQLSNPARS